MFFVTIFSLTFKSNCVVKHAVHSFTSHGNKGCKVSSSNLIRVLFSGFIGDSWFVLLKLFASLSTCSSSLTLCRPGSVNWIVKIL